jgi:hypothetical protein
MPVPLITSIAPKLHRVLPSGKEDGVGYQATCIASWIKAGFEVHSLNIAAELAEIADHYPGVIFHEAGRCDPSQGPPFVYLADMLRILSETGAAAGGIINSDVFTSKGAELSDQMAERAARSMIYAHRYDIKTVGGELTHSYFAHGYDFFMFPLAKLTALPDDGMVFGLPYWDYWLPLAIHGEGAPLAPIEDQDFLFHLDHVQRYPVGLDFWARFAPFFYGLLVLIKRLLGRDMGDEFERLFKSAAMITEDGRGSELGMHQCIFLSRFVQFYIGTRLVRDQSAGFIEQFASEDSILTMPMTEDDVEILNQFSKLAAR